MTTAPLAYGHIHRIDQPRVYVALVGATTVVPDITTLLPRRWDTVRHPDLHRVGAANLLVLDGTPELVAAARSQHPAATIVAVIEQDTPTTHVVRVLRAGADACVLAGSPAWLARQVVRAHRMRSRHTRIHGDNPWSGAA